MKTLALEPEPVVENIDAGFGEGTDAERLAIALRKQMDELEVPTPGTRTPPAAHTLPYNFD